MNKEVVVPKCNALTANMNRVSDMALAVLDWLSERPITYYIYIYIYIYYSI